MTNLLKKYNTPVPRYTSYPPANYFNESFTAKDYESALDASNVSEPRHLSFYFHIPFCRRLCYCCGCNSFSMGKQDKIDLYISALHKEMDRVLPYIDRKRQIAQIHFGGGTPTILPATILKELNDRLFSTFPAIDHPEVAIECHPAYSDETYWQSLIEAGFNRFSIGIQDFDEKVLKASNRKPALLPLEIIFQILRQKNTCINLDFIYGLPLQTVDSFSKSILKAIELQPDRLVTFSYAHVPWINKRQMLLEKTGLPAQEEKSRMYERAMEILNQAGYQSIGLDHFVKPSDELYTALQNRQLHRNFQGYCTRRTTGQVYAFGVTAISQLSGAYAQNSKTIDDYIARIDHGLAVVRGYSLSEDEQINREVIETLMCNYSLDWRDLSERLALPVEKIKQATAYDPARFRDFAADGVIAFDDDRIEIKPEGRLFVRNVAAALDKLMLHTDKVFSRPV
ncbi:MAG: oxygen-independent coproporphyrinogen III oxidase [Dysgonamonadaceae bacterium]|jgi:oxygen-independent coproporphyrinogen-3 oxidase|nr:oxygen-independent coproporphyrinogen III oxidase [Dysgonamonadaceae bacterium]